MTITADQERQFYDQLYTPMLAWPDQVLLVDPARYFACLDNPADSRYERRRLFQGTLERVLAQPLAGRTVLDYACGAGEWGVLLATQGARVTLLDLSPAAIEVCRRRARANGIEDRVRCLARSADDLTCFADGEFDYLVACGALHHTLKYPNSLPELARVLKPGGRGFLAETLGNNRLLNWARRLRWRLDREPEEAGEEIIVSDRELAALRQHFRRVEITPLNLLAMAKRLFRGRFHHLSVRALLGALEALDAGLLAVAPPLRRYCGEVIIVAEK